MKLTGKCKEDFEKWYLKAIEDLREDYHGYNKSVIISKFYREIDSMQYGVLVDFFDENEIYISMDWYGSIRSDSNYFEADINNDFGEQGYFRFKTRQEAREEAIKQANKIYNN